MATLPVARIEVGLTGPGVATDIWHIGDPVRGKVGVAKIGGEVWTDITAWVRNWSFRRGANSGAGYTVRYEAGTFTAELNNGDRRFDPTNVAGPYVTAGVSQLTPMVRVRLTLEWAGTGYRCWYGFADRWLPDYDTYGWSTTSLTATDGFKIVNQTRRALPGLTAAGEDSGARMHRVLDSIDWDANNRIIATGKSNLQGTNLGGSALAEAQLVQDTELGEFYMDNSGNAVFRNRHAAMLEDRSSTSQATLGDAGISTGEIPYVSLPVDYADDTMANRVSITRVGGLEQVVEDATSIERYLLKDYERSDLLMLTDSEALDHAQFVLGQGKDPELTFQRVGFNVPRPEAAAATWPVLLAAELGNRYTARRRPPGGGAVNEKEVFLRGIEMSSDGEDLKTTWQLQAAERQTYWTIGHATLGRIGRNAIAY